MTVPRSRCTMTLGKNTLKIGNWNVRTLYRTGNLAQAAREMNRRGISIMGISETHWTGQGKLQIAEGETIIYDTLKLGNEDTLKEFKVTLTNRYQVLQQEGVKLETGGKKKEETKDNVEKEDGVRGTRCGALQ